MSACTKICGTFAEFLSLQFSFLCPSAWNPSWPLISSVGFASYKQVAQASAGARVAIAVVVGVAYTQEARTGVAVTTATGIPAVETGMAETNFEAAVDTRIPCSATFTRCPQWERATRPS